jgi:hypothetical protein
MPNWNVVCCVEWGARKRPPGYALAKEQLAAIGSRILPPCEGGKTSHWLGLLGRKQKTRELFKRNTHPPLQANSCWGGCQEKNNEIVFLERAICKTSGASWKTQEIDN